jgi:hypothetical protein
MCEGPYRYAIYKTLLLTVSDFDASCTPTMGFALWGDVPSSPPPLFPTDTLWDYRPTLVDVQQPVMVVDPSLLRSVGNPLRHLLV